ncbi:putative membrane protein [Sphingomonas sp. UYAg733]
MTTKNIGLGNKIAPPRFLAFATLFVVGLAAFIPLLGKGLGAMAAFDTAAAVFLALVAPLLQSKAADMRQHAKDNDANRALLLAITATVTTVILVSVASEMMGGKGSSFATAMIVVTLVLAWLFSNTVYALHYAHLFYVDDGKGKDSGGVDIPATKEPDYWDFVYFSFTLGMTFQTSDVEISSSGIRRVTIGHCLAAFVFNIGVLAFTINVLGG